MLCSSLSLNWSSFWAWDSCCWAILSSDIVFASCAFVATLSDSRELIRDLFDSKTSANSPLSCTITSLDCCNAFCSSSISLFLVAKSANKVLFSLISELHFVDNVCCWESYWDWSWVRPSFSILILSSFSCKTSCSCWTFAVSVLLDSDKMTFWDESWPLISVMLATACTCCSNSSLSCWLCSSLLVNSALSWLIILSVSTPSSPTPSWSESSANDEVAAVDMREAVFSWSSSTSAMIVSSSFWDWCRSSNCLTDAVSSASFCSSNIVSCLIFSFKPLSADWSLLWAIKLSNSDIISLLSWICFWSFLFLVVAVSSLDSQSCFSLSSFLTWLSYWRHCDSCSTSNWFSSLFACSNSAWDSANCFLQVTTYMIKTNIP